MNCLFLIFFDFYLFKNHSNLKNGFAHPKVGLANFFRLCVTRLVESQVFKLEVIIVLNFLVIVILVALVVFFTKRFSDGKKEALNNVETGVAFLEKNKSVDGVKTTESGLQYQVISEGSGDKAPVASDKVTVHYHGTLMDGTVFDSSVERGQTIDFFLTQVIPGWTEGLQLMVVGEKTRLFIPSHLGYGNRKVGTIPGGSVLIFEVELLQIN